MHLTPDNRLKKLIVTAFSSNPAAPTSVRPVAYTFRPAYRKGRKYSKAMSSKPDPVM